MAKSSHFPCQNYIKSKQQQVHSTTILNMNREKIHFISWIVFEKMRYLTSKHAKTNKNQSITIMWISDFSQQIKKNKPYLLFEHILICSTRNYTSLHTSKFLIWNVWFIFHTSHTYYIHFVDVRSMLKYDQFEFSERRDEMNFCSIYMCWHW